MDIPASALGGPVPAATLEGLVVQLQAENAMLREQIATLTQIVQELQARLNKDSHNSSKPPSSDGMKKKPAPKSQRGQSGKPSGGQPGHRGSTLKMQAQPDHIVNHAPQACLSCGLSLRDVPAQGEGERRQVFDLPPLKLQVTEHRTERKTCPGCQQCHQGVFPASVSQPVQYGERIKGLAVYLTSYQMLPWERATTMLQDLFGASLSEGTLHHAQKDCHTIVQPLCDQIKEAIQEADVAHFDETGQRVAVRLHWLHVACTPMLTYYAIHQKRGRAAIDEIGILAAFAGRAIHDGWSSYQSYAVEHGLCNAHHLRELDFLREQYDQVWAARFKKFVLLDAKREVDAARAAGLTALPPERIQHFESQYDAYLQQGQTANPKMACPQDGRAKQTPGYNLIQRLKRRDQVLAFLYDLRVPFDNNQAERDLRMMKVRQKISGCFRTLAGAQTFNAIRGYLSTMRKQGHNMLRVLEAVFQGHPISPAFT